jgi:hypothetical protein
MENFSNISTTHAKVAMTSSWLQRGRACAPPLYPGSSQGNLCGGGDNCGEIVHEGHLSTRQFSRDPRTSQYSMRLVIGCSTTMIHSSTQVHITAMILETIRLPASTLGLPTFPNGSHTRLPVVWRHTHTQELQTIANHANPPRRSFIARHKANVI